MTKKLISIVVIAVLVLAMGGVLFWLNSEEPEQEELPVQTAEIVYITGGEEPLDVSGLEIRNREDSYTVIKAAGGGAGYTVRGMESLPLNTSTLNAIVNGLASLQAKSVVAEQGADLAAYGLTNPRATVTVSAGGESPVLLVGDDAPGGQGIYVMLQGQETVYLVAGYSGERWLTGSLGLLDLTISPGSAETAVIRSAELSGAVRAEPIRVEALDPDEDGERITMSTHGIVAPIKAELDLTYGADMLAGAMGVRADRAVAVYPDEAQLEALGLAEPYSVIYMTATQDEEDLSFTLSASEPDGEGMVHIISSLAPDVVYQVAADKLTWLEARVFDLRTKLLITPFIDSVGSVTVETPEMSHTFALAGEGDELTVTVAGDELDTANFRKFYQTLIAARFREEAEEEGSLEDRRPVLRYTYRYRSGGEDVISFYEGGARRVLISLNGQAPHTVESVYVDRVLEDLPKVVAGEDVKSYL